MEIENHYKGSVEDSIASCEGRHVQQVIYSTYHKALTQICFGCGKIRTSLPEKDCRIKEEVKGCGGTLWDEEGHCGDYGKLCLKCSNCKFYAPKEEIK